MATSLETKLQAAMQASPGLTSLLATRSDGKAAIYEMQEYQGSGFPAITVQLIDAVTQYSMTARMTTTPSRMQFTIWASDPETARNVESALMTFMDTFNAFEPTSAPKSIQPNAIELRRQGGNAHTQPLTYWRIVDVIIWNNELL